MTARQLLQILQCLPDEMISVPIHVEVDGELGTALAVILVLGNGPEGSGAAITITNALGSTDLAALLKLRAAANRRKDG